MTHLHDTDQAPYSAPVNDGGAAFPGGQFEPQHGGSNDREPWNHGMTMRDYFAAKALQGLISAHDSAGTWQAALIPDEVAKCAYMAADAMLVAREVRK